MHEKMSQFAENCTILSSNTKDLIYLNLMTISKILTINVSKVKIHELYLFLLYINIFDLIEWEIYHSLVIDKNWLLL